jgi:hypothetical protein
MLSLCYLHTTTHTTVCVSSCCVCVAGVHALSVLSSVKKDRDDLGILNCMFVCVCVCMCVCIFYYIFFVK